jgi:sugar/nucleoside kinase (ribokinase family)
VLFATEAEAAAMASEAGLLDLAPLVVLKRGSAGATVLARRPGEPALRLDVPTLPVQAADLTGAGDAFDAGFTVAWLRDPTTLRAAALAGHHAARREVIGPRPELRLL